MEDLTLAGFNEAAKCRGGIQVEIDYKEKEHSWIATAEVVDMMTSNSPYGAYEQPTMNGIRKETFTFTKAIHKTQVDRIIC